MDPPTSAAPEGAAIPSTAHDAKDGPIVQIRPFEPKDIREVRLLLGYGVMEQLALANSLLYINPLVIAAWLALSSIMIQWLSWWPQPSGPTYTWLLPLPALASCAVPLLFAIDWLNRAYFEHQVRHILAREDTMDIPGYYGRAEGSGFWVLQYKGAPIGLVASDTYQPLGELKGFEEIKAEADAQEAKAQDEGPKTRSAAKKAQEQKKEEGKKPAGKVVYIRHFHLDSPYRPAYIQNDLFAHGLAHAFQPPSVEKAYFKISRLTPWLGEVSRTMGMKPCAAPEGAASLRKAGVRRGIQDWPEEWVGVGREEWEKRYEEMRELHGL